MRSFCVVVVVVLAFAASGCKSKPASRVVELTGLDATIDLTGFGDPAPSASGARLEPSGRPGVERVRPASAGGTVLVFTRTNPAVRLELHIEPTNAPLREALVGCVRSPEELAGKGATRPAKPRPHAVNRMGAMATADVSAGGDQVLTFTMWNGALCYWVSAKVKAGDAEALAAARRTLETLDRLAPKAPPSAKR